ncbi:MAG: hypothetical protein V3U24_06870, partial [Candidatus Neomarinimicrobiota bacterium]
MRRRHRIVTLVVVAISLSLAFGQKRDALGIPHFQALTPAHPTESPDTVRLAVIVKVPYDAIQFLKQGNSFQAEYELAVTIQDAEENQIVERIRQHAVTTDKYRQTISSRTFDLPMQTFRLVPAEYKCIIELTDEDTRKSGRQTIDLNLSRFTGDVVIGDLVLVDPQTKTDDYPAGIPIIPSRIADTDSVFHIYYNTRIPTGEYTLQKKTISVEDEVLTEETMVRNTPGPTVTEVIEVRQPDVPGNKFKLKLKVEQGGESSESELVVEIRWLGLKAHVSNLDEAVEQ